MRHQVTSMTMQLSINKTKTGSWAKLKTTSRITTSNSYSNCSNNNNNKMGKAALRMVTQKTKMMMRVRMMVHKMVETQRMMISNYNKRILIRWN
jgi:hypothetical protein